MLRKIVYVFTGALLGIFVALLISAFTDESTGFFFFVATIMALSTSLAALALATHLTSQEHTTTTPPRRSNYYIAGSIGAVAVLFFWGFWLIFFLVYSLAPTATRDLLLTVIFYHSTGSFLVPAVLAYLFAVFASIAAQRRAIGEQNSALAISLHLIMFAQVLIIVTNWRSLLQYILGNRVSAVAAVLVFVTINIALVWLSIKTVKASSQS